MGLAQDALLFFAVNKSDIESITLLLAQDANPFRPISTCKMTAMDIAACIGNPRILAVLIDHCFDLLESALGPQQRPTFRKELYEPNSSFDLIKEYISANSCAEELELPPSDAYSIQDNMDGYFNIRCNEESLDLEDIQTSNGNSRSNATGLSSHISPPELLLRLEYDDDIEALYSDDQPESRGWHGKILESFGGVIDENAILLQKFEIDSMCKPLHNAAKYGRLQAMQMFLDSGCRLDMRNELGLTALHEAVKHGQTEAAQALISAGTSINAPTYFQLTPLHLAAKFGHCNLAEMLVKAGAFLDARDICERTPLIWAATNGHTAAAIYLITAGANVNSEDIHKNVTALHLAAEQGDAPLVKALLAAGARITQSQKILHWAVTHRKVDMVQSLVGIRGTMHFDEMGDTPLLLAARISEPHLVRIFLDEGSSPYTRNAVSGITLLHVAIEGCKPLALQELIHMLLEHNVSLDFPATCKHTPLEFAIRMLRKNAVELLVKHGAEVNTTKIRSWVRVPDECITVGIIRLLVKGGLKLDPPNDQDAYPETGTVTKWIYHFKRNPLTLLDLSCISIRRNIRQPLYKNIEFLQLPKVLLKTLMLEGEGA